MHCLGQLFPLSGEPVDLLLNLLVPAGIALTLGVIEKQGRVPSRLVEPLDAQAEQAGSQDLPRLGWIKARFARVPNGRRQELPSDIPGGRVEAGNERLQLGSAIQLPIPHIGRCRSLPDRTGQLRCNGVRKRERLAYWKLGGQSGISQHQLQRLRLEPPESWSCSPIPVPGEIPGWARGAAHHGSPLQRLTKRPLVDIDQARQMLEIEVLLDAVP